MIEPPFQDRRHAGTELAHHLNHYSGQAELVVLGLPRGGVPVAAEVAAALGAELDVLVVRKIGVPHQPELAMGAVASVAGQVETVRNEDVLHRLADMGANGENFDEVANQELAELNRREDSYRAGRGALDLAGKTVLLVDDGLATGASMRAAVTATRHLQPAQVVVAVPVASPQTCQGLRSLADEVVCGVTPESFSAVGAGYVDFSQTTDEEVREILTSAASS